MWALLVGCTCPSFDEMAVDDADGAADEGVLAHVEGALADFASWTGREGVCVPEIEVREDLPEPARLAEGYAVSGQYRGPRKAIRVTDDTFSDIASTTRHELCHALDHEEGHSSALAWPALAERALYDDEETAVLEDFALACQEEPIDLALETLVAERCGSPADESARYLWEVVYPDAPQVAMRAEDTFLDVTRRAWDGVPPGVEIDDVVRYDGGVAVATLEPAATGGFDIVVRRFDADLAPLPGEVRLEVGSEGLGARFVPADEGLYLIRTVPLPGGTWASDLLALDLVAGTARDLPVAALPEPLAISGGVLYAGGWGAALLAWRLDGLELGLDPPDGIGMASAVWPERDGGVGFLADTDLWRLDGGAWSSTRSPGYGHAYVPLGDDRGYVVASREGTRVFLFEGGTWSFASDPCVDADLPTWLTLVGAGEIAVEIPRGEDDALRYVAEYAVRE